MKSVLSMVVLSLSLVTGAFAHAAIQSSPLLISANITKVVYIDSFLHHLNGVTGGHIALDRGARNAKLTLDRPFYCPADSICAQVMPAPVVIELPIVAKKTDPCGTVIYTALRDARPVDGILETLEVRDNTANTCKTLVALAPTDIKYNTASVSRMTGIEGRTFSRFFAEKLR
jgi:hypothetical protein